MSRLLIFILLLMLVLLQYQLWFSSGGLPEVWELEKTREHQRQENSDLARRNQSLAAEVRDLKEGSEAVEERARSEMGMIKQGETFIQVIPAEPDRNQ